MKKIVQPLLQGAASFISNHPLHLFLLPVFFIAFKYNLYEGFLTTGLVVKSWLLVTVVLTTSAFLFKPVVSSFQKAAAFITCLGFAYLFFGDLREFLQNTKSLHWFSHYKVLLPLIALAYLLLYLFVKRNTQVNGLVRYLNIFLLLICSIEVVQLFTKNKQPYQPSAEIKQVVPYDSLKGKLPDIYFIVPDCYPSTTYQAEMLQSNNSAFDDSLTSKGFRLISQSKSNYNRTAFSMLSTFQLHPVSWLQNESSVNAKDFNRAMNEVKEAPFFHLLQQYKYQFINLSIFDITDQPAYRKEYFLNTEPDELIFKYSFGNYFIKDIGFHWFADKKEALRKKLKAHYSPLKTYSKNITDSILNIKQQQTDRPRFVYLHLSFPHYPYFYNEEGKPYTDEEVFIDSMITDRKKFAAYIQYANKELLKIINSLQQKKSKHVILLQSDHGIADLDPTRKQDAFSNYSAIYFSDADYKLVYDSMSNVNSLRVIVNKYFGQQLPMLPDETFYIHLK